MEVFANIHHLCFSKPIVLKVFGERGFKMNSPFIVGQEQQKESSFREQLSC